MKFRSRPGFSMIETIAAVAILGLLMVAIAQVSMMRVNNQEAVDAQYSVLAADAVMADIYSDFHAALSYSFTESAGGQRMLTFVLRDGGSNIYSLDVNDDKFYKNGIFQLEATQFDVIGTPESMTVSLKLPSERLLDYTICR